MLYGKIENGSLIYAPRMLTVEDRVHYHPSGELYNQFGYLPIEETLPPEQEVNGEGIVESPKYYTSSYIEQGGKIVKIWTETEPPEPIIPQPTVEDRLCSLEGRMSASEQADTDIEIAITEVYETVEGV